VATIGLSDVSKTFLGDQAAVRGITLDIADGELLVLVGPSGSGKSTVLRLIAGLESPSSGAILIDGQDVTDMPASARDLAMVFQSYALYPHMSVRGNLAFGLRMRRLSAPEIDARVQAAAAMLQIEPLLDRRPAQLSGGQRQRVALGRAIVRSPNAFLLDEPLSNLDPLLRVTTRTELALLQRRLGATMVYVTHDQEEAMTLGRRVAILRAGRIAQIGTPLDLFRRPASAFVAEFIGSPAMNLSHGVAAGTADGLCVVSPLCTIDARFKTPALAGGAEVLVGVRPHDIELAPIGEADGAGRVVIAEPLGAATIVHLSLDASPGERVRIVVSADRAVAIDDRVGYRVRRDRIHLFDGTSGRRIE
jgi:multiple sugar transport system ATP-binding protein